MANPTTTNQYNSQTQPGLLGSGGISNASTTTPGYQGAFGAAGVPFAPGTPQAIPLGIGVANTPKMDLPPKPTSTAAANLTSAANGVIGTGTQPTGTGTQTPKTPTTPKTTTSTGSNYIDKAWSAFDTGVSDINAQYDLTNRLNLSNEAQKKSQANDLKYATMEDKIRKQAGMTSGQADAKIAAIERDRAYETAALAMDYAAKSNDYTSMAALADKQVALLLEKKKDTVDFYNTLRGEQFQLARDQAQRDYDTSKANLEILNKYKLDLLTDGKITADAFGKITNWEDFSAYTGLNKADAVTEAAARSTIDVIDDALTNKRGLRGAAGVGLWSRSGLLRGKVKQDFIGSVEQIAGQLTIDKLVQAKSNGATFGALSDGERQLVASASSKLGSWAERDSTGKITGWKASENSVKNELQKIKDFAILDYERRTGNTYVAPIQEHNGIILPGNTSGGTYLGFTLPNN